MAASGWGWPQEDADAPPPPEPGGSPARPPGRHPWWRNPAHLVHLPFALVLFVAAIGIERIVEYHWRAGSTLIGGALLLAAFLRAVVPPERTGLLAVRSRAVDVLGYGAFGMLTIAVSITIVGGPFN